MKLDDYKLRMPIFLTTILMLAFEISWTLLWLYTDIIRNRIPPSMNYDFLYYITSILVCAFSFLILYHIFFKRLPPVYSESKQRELLLEILAYLTGGTILGMIFIFEPLTADANSFSMPWHTTRRIEFLFMILAFLLALQLRIGANILLKVNQHEKKHTMLKVWYLLLALVVAYSVYQPNCFLPSFTAEYNLHHAHAYFNSVYRVLHLQPYNQINLGIYGFYGIILAPFVKLLGGSFSGFVLILSILAGISMLCYFYVLDNLVNTIWIKLVGSIGAIACYVAIASNIYFQSYPHRMIFIGIILAFIVWKHKYNKHGKCCSILGLGLVTLSLVWNLETGIACLFAYIGSNIVYELQSRPLSSPHCLYKILLNLIHIPLSLISAFVFVGVYNYIVARQFITIDVFLFPFIGNPLVNSLNIDLGKLPSAWMTVSALFFIVIGIILLNTKLCNNITHKNSKIIIITACTISAAIQMIYYINRSVWGNLFLILTTATIMMCYLVEYFAELGIWNRNLLGNGILRALSIITLTLLITNAFITVGKYLPIEAERENNRDTERIKLFCEQIREDIPENTLGIGKGIPELYSYLDWDTGYYGIDMSDYGIATEQSKKYVYDLLIESDYIFINDSILNDIPNYMNESLEVFFRTHQAITTYDFEGQTYTYYCHNEVGK